LVKAEPKNLKWGRRKTDERSNK